MALALCCQMVFFTGGGGQHIQLLNSIMQQKAVTIEELGHALEKWGPMVKHYEDRSTTKIPDEIKTTIIQNMCPKSLRMHLEMKSA